MVSFSYSLNKKTHIFDILERFKSEFQLQKAVASVLMVLTLLEYLELSHDLSWKYEQVHVIKSVDVYTLF